MTSDEAPGPSVGSAVAVSDAFQAERRRSVEFDLEYRQIRIRKCAAASTNQLFRRRAGMVDAREESRGSEEEDCVLNRRMSASRLLQIRCSEPDSQLVKQ